MKILSIETSGKICAVALLENDQVIKEELIEDENTHSVKLMPLIDKLLQETNTKLEQIDLFACDIGPGSFTGIRIGVSTIKAFLDVTHQKAVGISSLEALAYQVKDEGLICSLIDAKNENVYGGLFERKEGKYRQKGDFKFDNIHHMIASIKNSNKKIFFVGNGSFPYQDMIESKIEKAEVIKEPAKNKLTAIHIGLAAYYKRQEAVDSHHLMPLYLRKSSAERN